MPNRTRGGVRGKENVERFSRGELAQPIREIVTPNFDNLFNVQFNHSVQVTSFIAHF
jgi:hypothetical protein